MDASPLARLPAELRIHIYEYALTSQYAVTMKSNAARSSQRSLIQTCRQIRDETLAMFFSMTRFNAHLDDGPTTPLTRWLQAQGPDQILRIKQLDIWDMHIKIMTLLGEAATAALLQTHPDGDPSKSYHLQPLGTNIATYMIEQGLKTTTLSLRDMGLGLRRICIDEGSTPSPENTICTQIFGDLTMALTSSFAVVRLDTDPAPSNSSQTRQKLPDDVKGYT